MSAPPDLAGVRPSPLPRQHGLHPRRGGVVRVRLDLTYCRKVCVLFPPRVTFQINVYICITLNWSVGPEDTYIVKKIKRHLLVAEDFCNKKKII